MKIFVERMDDTQMNDDIYQDILRACGDHCLGDLKYSAIRTAAVDVLEVTARKRSSKYYVYKAMYNGRLSCLYSERPDEDEASESDQDSRRERTNSCNTEETSGYVVHSCLALWNRP